MTTFREYRQAMTSGVVAPGHAVPTLPTDAIPFQGTRAGFVSRLVSACIDVALVLLVVLGTAAVIWLLSFIVDPMSGDSTSSAADRLPPLYAMVVYGYGLNWLYWTVGWATSGRTIGNLVMGLRVVNFEGRPPRWIGAALRAAFCMVFPFGLLWVVVSGANRSLQDVVLRTSVVYDWVVSIPGFRRAGRLD